MEELKKRMEERWEGRCAEAGNRQMKGENRAEKRWNKTGKKRRGKTGRGEER